MGFIDFTNGEVLTADQMDTVMRQSIMRFADAAARDTALSEVLAEGMMAYLDDTNEVLKYDGSQWIDISGDISGVTAGTALTGGGTSGNVTLDVDETALTIAQSQVTDLTTDLAGKQDDVITTQGDLVIGDASGDPVRLPVGTADQVLTSDGTTVSFQDAGGGGWTLIATATSDVGDAILSITNIPQTFKALKLVFTDVAQTGASGNNIVALEFFSSGSQVSFFTAGFGFDGDQDTAMRVANATSTGQWSGFAEFWGYDTQNTFFASSNSYQEFDSLSRYDSFHKWGQFTGNTFDEIRLVAGFNSFDSGVTLSLFGLS